MEKFIKKLKDKINKISDKWDIYIEEKEKNEIIINDKKPEKIKNSNLRGIALRIFKKNKMSFVSALIGNGDIDHLIDKLKDSLFIEGYKEHKFFSRDTDDNNLKLYDANIKRESFKSKTKKLLEMEKYTKNLSKKIKHIRDIGYFENFENIFYLNSDGFKDNYTKAYIYTFLSVIASDKNDEVVVDGIKSGIKFNDFDFKKIGEKTAERAINLLNAKSVPSGKYNLIFPYYIASEFISYIAPLFFAENIRKKKSLFWQNKDGDKILSENITIKDDACENWQIGSFPFDGEGNSGFNKVIVEKGILKDFLYDNINAVYFNKDKPGNSLRPDFNKLPQCGAANFYIEKGNYKLNEILKNFSGIFINSIMGGHTIDTVSGNFSLGINGWLYKNGKMFHPIKETLMTGNLKELFYNVEYVFDDLDFYFNFGSPSLFIKDVLISGKE